MGILLNLLGLGNKRLDLLGSNQAVRTSLGSIKEVLGAKVRKTYLVWALRIRILMGTCLELSSLPSGGADVFVQAPLIIGHVCRVYYSGTPSP